MISIKKIDYTGEMRVNPASIYVILHKIHVFSLMHTI